MKIIIAGGRNYKDYQKLVLETTKIITNIPAQELYPVEIVSGKQVTRNPITKEKYGADYLGERFAKEVGYPIKEFPANWDKYGPSAGPRRNKEMAEYGDILICFWDMKSRGTKNMIDNMRKLNKDVYIIKY